MKQSHGADVYHPDGRSGHLTDFSNTVMELDAPAGLNSVLERALPSLRRYPQPYSVGLASHIEKSLGLAPGSVLVGAGSSQCLEWIAGSLSGRRVLLETPCFGEYEIWLSRHGAKIARVGADEPFAPEWTRVKAALKGAHSYWSANPSNPSGLCYGPEEVKEQLQYCREKGILFVLDEALHAQCLKPQGDAFLKACAAKPGALAVRSLSKGLGLPGLRLGFVAGHPLEISKLGRLLNPWEVSSLAQEAGPWIFKAEKKFAKARAAELRRRKADLLKRLLRVAKHLMPRPSDTGFFLARLLSREDDAARLAGRLKARGVLVRGCASFGGWGEGHVRFNPLSPKENETLVRALEKEFKLR